MGLFLLSQLAEVFPTEFIGLYKDESMAATAARPRQAEILKKKICQIFSENNLKITIDANLKVANFLDITLDLEREIFRPYMKDNHTPLYVDSQSNHPPLVLKNIPLGVNRRLSKISANKEVFDSASPPYQDALIKSGYDHILKYEPPELQKAKKRTRKKKVTWFNPPYSMHVKTNVGKEFLRLVDTAFPPSNPLHKLFTRHTLKISYRCMPNMASTVAMHNKSILGKKQQRDPLPCKCKTPCPIGGNCGVADLVYEATVKEKVSNRTETYTGLTYRTFKERYKEHMYDMGHAEKRTSSKLAGHIWDLKDRGVDFDITWRMLARATHFNPITRKCNLCLKEKHFIMYGEGTSTLNKRSEIFNTCRHRTKALLVNV